ncbi:MAG: enoyl-CoA hydratase/isomerase family protein [Spirochaetes bacterium]|nr:enoyl-CoA hydratase/isomerase family protein [Spirochaetota bacterium]
MENTVLYQREGALGKITLNNPEKSNPLSLEVLRELIRLFRFSRENNDLCVIYCARGKNFTFGADLKDGYDLIVNTARRSEAAEDLMAWQELTTAMMEHPGVIIVGYHGWIVGGGFEHTLCCDLRIAADDTMIMLPEIDLGIFFSNASTKLLPRIVGEGRAKEMMMMGGVMNAEEAFRIGLVNRVCSVEELDEVLQDYAGKIATKDPLALALAKKTINEAQERSLEEVLYREFRGMMQTGQSGGAERRIRSFLKK